MLTPEIVSAYRATRARLIRKGYDASPARCLEMARADLERGQRTFLSPTPDSMLWGAADSRGERWCEDTERAGLRFVGWSDDMGAADHYGWYSDPHGDGDTYRGCVYALPARNGVPLYVSGYRVGSASHASRGRDWTDTNPGSARLDMATLWRGERGGYQFDAESDSEARAAAREGDRMAQRDAESESAYQEAWQAGSRYADLVETAKAESVAARALVREIKSKRGELAGPICEALRGAVRRHRETIAKAREETRELLRDYEGGHGWDAFSDGAGL